MLYTLEYYLGKKKVETIMYELPLALCRWKKKVLINSTHSKGKFKIVKIKTKNSI